MIYRLASQRPDLFPDPDDAEPDGLLAIGGDLTPERLLGAYSRGIFPWYSGDTPPLWWSPDPRCVILPDTFRLPATVRRELKKSPYTVTVNRDFAGVIAGCAATPRRKEHEACPSEEQPQAEAQPADAEEAGDRDAHTTHTPLTWIGPAMRNAYCRLHELGFAHSVEAWDEEGLAGGLYGVSLGRAFFGESMFHVRSNASKIALASFLPELWDKGFTLVDCQMETPHILRYGARNIPRADFRRLLATALGQVVST